MGDAMVQVTSGASDADLMNYEKGIVSMINRKALSSLGPELFGVMISEASLWGNFHGLRWQHAESTQKSKKQIYHKTLVSSHTSPKHPQKVSNISKAETSIMRQTKANNPISPNNPINLTNTTIPVVLHTTVIQDTNAATRPLVTRMISNTS
jgi:hypothetical protein